MQLFADQDLAPQFVGEKNVLVQSEIGLPSEAWRESRLSLGKHFENVWLGFMSETPRWRLSGGALWKASMRRSPCGTVRHKTFLPMQTSRAAVMKSVLVLNLVTRPSRFGIQYSRVRDNWL